MLIINMSLRDTSRSFDVYICLSPFSQCSEAPSWRGDDILFRRADTLGNKRLDFFFGR